MGEVNRRRGSAAPGRKAAKSKDSAQRKSAPTKPSKSRSAAARGARKAGRTGSASAGKRRGGTGRERRSKQEMEKTVRIVRVRELDPTDKIGPNTSVQRLFRVDTERDGSGTAHLVFYDRHGLYCEHGRDCVAVGEVRKLDRKTFGSTLTGSTDNGRMRA